MEASMPYLALVASKPSKRFKQQRECASRAELTPSY